ncbi:GNAT family N-acetyltransferase [Amycolatopsis nalaikhensis]|uniref:GNAT family N-acetyltransferase n=1 Tax=Amycolatopsis nalaikhensis TaxID=715472 RepID=A0ABY8XYC7_9PSEU|nr:GNAT family N-acetyltransferase [Amycolatopsis sp. 2-2]WIV60724.1 GNAT family N-acetyltransferase [Amycolatopsis sp. 2-2]
MTTGQPAVGGPRSGARGEYGDLLPIRPAAGVPVQCLRGEYLTHYGMTQTYSHRYRLHGTLCETCRLIEARDQAERRLSEWAHLDTAIQYPPDAAPQQGLVLVVRPPGADTLTGHIELRLDGAVTGTATITCCTSCRSATLDYVQVAAGYRRLGYGRTLVAVARARMPGYTWTAPLPEGGVAQAFRARLPYPRAAPACVHRRDGSVD